MKDIGASVLAKLKNKAKDSGISYQQCLLLFFVFGRVRSKAAEYNYALWPNEFPPIIRINIRQLSEQELANHLNKITPIIDKLLMREYAHVKIAVRTSIDGGYVR